MRKINWLFLYPLTFLNLVLYFFFTMLKNSELIAFGGLIAGLGIVMGLCEALQERDDE